MSASMADKIEAAREAAKAHASKIFTAGSLYWNQSAKDFESGYWEGHHSSDAEIAKNAPTLEGSEAKRCAAGHFPVYMHQEMQCPACSARKRADELGAEMEPKDAEIATLRAKLYRARKAIDAYVADEEALRARLETAEARVGRSSLPRWIRRVISCALLACAAVRPVSALDPGRMECRYLDGSAQILAIDGAREFNGAVAYKVGTDAFVTTRECMFNIGPGKEEPSWSAALGPVLMTCDGPDGLPVYVALASHAIMRQGVWLWREDETGDRYLSLAPCIAEPGW